MKLLSFLGVGRYGQTCYVWNNQECITSFSPVASCQFLQPDTLILFLTEEAEQCYAREIRSQLPPGVNLETLQVPHGRNELELWQIFDRIGACVRRGEEVAFDITNGLRSFPLVGLLAAAFLRSGLEVNLKAVLYGAYDVRDTSTEPNRTSMFDLSPMITLLEWSSAADRFKQTGDARSLAQLIGKERRSLALQETGDRSGIELAAALGALSDTMQKTSQALHLTRPAETMVFAARLPDAMNRAIPALDRSPAARPFTLLLEQVAGVYSPLGLSEELQQQEPVLTLEKQRNLIAWYIEREQWVQAITLMREWLVNWMLHRLDSVDWLDLKTRRDVEERLSTDVRLFRDRKLPLSGPEGYAQIVDLWGQVTDTRNDIDHAGMRSDPRSSADLVKHIPKIYQRLSLVTI